jgi:predicted permease
MTAPDDDLDDEVRFHLEARAEALIREGQTPDEAARQARREFGDLDGLRGYVRGLEPSEGSTRRWRAHVALIGQDVRYAWRGLRRAPAFTLTAALTIALGIGGTAAVFSVVNSVVFRPLPFSEPGQLYAVYSANRTADLLRAAVSPVDLDDWRARRDRLQDVGGFWYAEGNSGVTLTGRGAPRRLSSVFIERGFLSTLGVEPARGRLPRDEELVRGGPHDVVMLTHRFWTREFGADPAVVGSALTVNGRPFTVIGVLPASMTYPVETADVFVPYAVIPDQSIPRIRQVRVLSVVARAKPGVTIEGVRAEMAAITAALALQHPENSAWGEATVERLHDVVVGPVRDGLLVLFGAVAMVWILVCVNVASLQLARAFGRARELAVRVALGASRGQLVRQLLIESLALSAIGGALGLALGYGGMRGLLVLASGQLPRSGEVRMDGAVMGFAALLSVATGLVFGIVPALRASRSQALAALREAGRGTLGRGHRRWRGALIVAEVAFSMMLVIGAGLMGRSFLALTRVDSGFDPDRLLAVQFTIDPDRYGPRDPSPGAPAPYAAVYQRFIERVRAVPGVVAAAAVKDPPYRGSGERVAFRVPERPVPPGEDPPTAVAIHISDGYFATLRTPLRQGREFTPLDRAGAPMVVVVNEAFERRFFPGQRAAGRTLLLGQGLPAQIAGVVADIRQVAVATPASPTLYLHNLQNSRVKTTIVARTEGDPASFAAAIRDAIWSVDPAQPLTAVFTFDDSVSRALARPRLLTVLIGGFGLVGLVLGALGVYGLLASTVGERRREIGVRLALGARPTQVLAAVVRRGLLVTSAGVVIGLAGAWALARFLEAVLYGVEPTDPGTLAGTSLVLLAVSALASWIPARRAARVPPTEALRE